MSDLFETVKGGQDIFKKLLSYIPGFSGYMERTNRRAADKLLRDQVALKYSELVSAHLAPAEGYRRRRSD